MRRQTVIAGTAFGAIPVVILAAALACTRAVALGASPRWRLAFRPLCHGIATRCYVLWNVPMPICARCTGIYVGLLAGIVVAFGVLSLRPWGARIGERVLRIAMFTAGGALAMDGLTQLARLRESTNDLRLATGLAAGFTFGLWVLSALEASARRMVASP